MYIHIYIYCLVFVLPVCAEYCACMQTLLPRIVQLWEQLQVPLVHRSRFYLAFKGRETFYYEAEHRRLVHQHSQVHACAIAACYF